MRAGRPRSQYNAASLAGRTHLYSPVLTGRVSPMADSAVTRDALY